MSKILYINTNRVLMPDDTYFPFTHTISDLENVNIIGIPATKPITLPRCPQNDEIFGYIADITRCNYVYSDDYYIGVSFNQTKKCNYTLYDDSELVSEGLLSLDNITDTTYEVTLYDELIQKLELLNGNPETGEYYLSSCGIISGSNHATMSMASNSTNIYSSNSTSSYVKPVVCIKDGEFDPKIIRALTLPSYTYQNVTLPSDCTSLQLRTLKNYEVNYATSIKNVIDSINLKYPNTLTTSSLLDNMLSEVQLLCKSPQHDKGTYMQTSSLNPYSTNYSDMTYRVVQLGTGTDLCLTNGHKKFELNLSASWSGDATIKIGGVLADGFGTWTETYTMSDPDGTLFSKQWAKVYLGNSVMVSNPVYYEIDFYKNQNALTPDADIYGGTYCNKIDLNTTLNIELDFFPQFKSSADVPTYLYLEMQNYSPAETNMKWKLLDGLADVSLDVLSILSPSKLTETQTEFRTNDIVKGENVFPKVSIKSFILQLAKFFNLDILNSGGILVLQPKAYHVSGDNLLFEGISSMNTKNITFSKLVLTTGLPKSTILDSYKKFNKKTYGEQIIDTRYTIKNVTKPIVLETAVPLLLKDYNYFAYDRFAGYANNGYAKSNHGVVTEIAGDNITLGYINVVPETIYITDDTAFEGNMSITGVTGSVETKFVHYNPKLVVNTALADTNVSKFYFTSSVDPSYGCKTLNNYMTFSPYKFTGTTVSASLDMNKSVTSYANMTDADYPSTTTLYHRFHRNMIIDKYNSNTHILTARIYVEGKIDIYNIYNYKNTNYTISKIVEYDPTIPGVYEVELMRVNDVNNYTTNILI